jgi:hypothetical protein
MENKNNKDQMLLKLGSFIKDMKSICGQHLAHYKKIGITQT